MCCMDPCTIAPKSISGFTMTTTNPTYDYANLVTSTVTLKDGSYTLTAGTDYTVSGNTTYASDNNQSRTATCTGKGNYTGTKTATWYCAKANQNPSISVTRPDVLHYTASISGSRGTVTWSTGETQIGTGTSVNISIAAWSSVILYGLTANCAGNENWNPKTVNYHP